MSHAVTRRADGKNEMAAASGVAVWWEGGAFGNAQRLADGATIEEWTVAAGLDWKVKRAKVRYPVNAADASNPAAWRTMDDRHVLVRSDNGAALGIVSDSYKVVQPREAVEFFRDLIQQAGFRMNTAGSLHGGAKVWAQCSIAEDAIGRGDFNKGQCLFSTSFDHSAPTDVRGVNTSVVCANTLGFAMAETGGKVVRVSHKSQFDAVAVKARLGLAVDSYSRFLADARLLAAARIGGTEAEDFVARVMGEPATLDTVAAIAKAVKVRESRGFRRVMELFNGAGRGSDLPSRKQTLWGLVNGVTDYVDHDVRATSVENRIDSATFGLGDKLKSAAFAKALELVRA